MQEVEQQRVQLQQLSTAAEADRGAALGMLREAEASLRASHTDTKRCAGVLLAKSNLSYIYIYIYMHTHFLKLCTRFYFMKMKGR